MERYYVLKDYKNEYYKTVHFTQRDVQIQCNPDQCSSATLHRTRTILKHRGPHMYKEEQIGRHRIP